ncbi:protein translocase subunit SecD [Clostridium sp. YIM B02551]|uniref:protein translocase subunit SecD n=1 Tax=Clostridium sp. YIM B02551 TaxID=2910679 RepID=UPI001EEBCF0B|nr:protein translocase subunit SecD [Clostridium sp. YIM B02551]
MKTKGRSTILFILLVGFIFLFTYIGFFGAKIFGWEYKSYDKAITKGLDLQGGVSVLMEMQEDKVSTDDRDKTKEMLSLRVNKVGVSETVVTTEGEKRIRIDIPGQYDSKTIVDSLNKTGELKFIAPNQSKDVILTGKDVKKATVYTDQQNANQPVIGLELNEDGKQKFAEATQKYLGQQISIYMDDQLLTSPTVQSVISNGEAQITGNKSFEEAKKTAGIINAGALPVPVKVASVKTVGAQLGATALPNAIKAAFIGFALVFLLMVLYYRVPGFLACIALILYASLVLTCFAGLNATLTLPGIAGFLLTVGMAVDANVLIFERIREELKKGKSIKSSINEGFKHAMSSIIDSNITTSIAALVLYFLGSGAVKGFATTLLIGIIVSMFTAIFVTRALVNLAANMGLLSKLWCFRVKRGE